ncbi:MAG: hypothetical protein HXY46_05365 [Syntrophaceae bacterium]|nr:hypothetical protein [Syntrophaceae bacterium]
MIKEMCLKEGVSERELRLGVRTRKFSRAEIGRQLGVCTSAIAKAIQNMEGAENKC